MGDASGRKRINPADVRRALDGILQSETFSRSERSRELLKYIVDRDLDGEADRLKGFAIALDVFGREDNFDPSTDAVVRVQAGRLRDLLETYYTGEGANDPVHISVPRGSYVPVYDVPLNVPRLGLAIRDGLAHESGAPAMAPPGGTAGAGHGDRMFYVSLRLFSTVVAVVSLMFAGIIALLIQNHFTTQANQAAQEQLAKAVVQQHLSASEALPSVSLTLGAPEPLRAAFEDAIPRFGSVVYRSDRSVTIDQPLADFYIDVRPSGKISHSIQLYHRQSGILIGTEHIPGNLTDAQLTDHTARVMSRFLPVGGVIYGFLESDGLLNPLTKCLALGSTYFNDQTAGLHEAAYRCHQELIADGVKSPLSYAELASLTIEKITDRHPYPPKATLADAIQLARRSVELAPNSAQAHRALGRSLLVNGEHGAALDQIREAYALNRYDLGIAASYGNTLVAIGDFPTALGVLDRATKANPVHPTWWDFAMFVAAFQQDRRDLVSASARNLVGRDRPHYCAARLIAAYLDGDEELRQKMLVDLKEEEDHVFTDNPEAYYARIMPKSAARKLALVLREAGLKPEAAHQHATEVLKGVDGG